jgi:hypothetical protein
MLTGWLQNKLMTPNLKAKEAFYNDLSEAEAEKSYGLLVPHSQDALETPVDYVASDLTIPKAYVVCEIDQVRETTSQALCLFIRLSRYNSVHVVRMTLADKAFNVGCRPFHCRFRNNSSRPLQDSKLSAFALGIAPF